MPNSQKPPVSNPAQKMAGSQSRRRGRNEPALHACARSNDVESIKRLLAEGVSPNERAGVRLIRTPLMLAASMGHVEATKILLPVSDLGLRDAHGLDALSHAATSESMEVLNLILSAGASPAADSETGKTPLHHAALSQRTEMVKRLLPMCDPNKKDTYGATPLHLACFDLADVEPGWSKDTECARLLAAVSAIDEPNDDNQTPLHYAVRHNRGDCVRVLLSAGADAGWRDKEGNTPLIAAAKSGSVEAIADLLAVSDASARDKEGNTALLIAAAREEPELVSLLANREDAQMANRDGVTPLIQASMQGNIEAMRILAPFSDANAQTSEGNTALTHAFWSANAPGIDLLAPLTDRSGRDPEGRSFIERAATQSNPDAWRFLAPHLSGAELEEMALALMKKISPELGARMEGHLLRLEMVAGEAFAPNSAPKSRVGETATQGDEKKKPPLRM